MKDDKDPHPLLLAFWLIALFGFVAWMIRAAIVDIIREATR